MIFRFPDKPTETTPEFLARLPERNWLAQDKYDGWQIQVHWDGDKMEVYSSSGAHTTPIPQGQSIFASPSLAKMEPHLITGLRSLEVPDRTVIPMEWVGPRGEQEQGIYIFDMMAWADEWLVDVPFEARWARCQTLLDQVSKLPGSLVVANLAAWGIFWCYHARFHICTTRPT